MRQCITIIKGLLVAGLLFFGTALPGRTLAAVAHEAGLDWRTLFTPHFRVHYHEGLEDLARQAGAIAERAHTRLAPLIGWEPEERTHIILTGELGVANGWATPVPDNRSAIYVTPPDSVSGLEDHAGWLETVIVHEYAHILHLDKVRGFPDGLRSVFGRYPSPLPFSVFPNAFQPGWVIEGLATWYETDRTRGMGRGQSSYFNMLMRMEVQRGVRSYREVNQPVVDWPGGHLHYLYGVHFFNFVEASRGTPRIRHMIEDMSDDFIPFRVNANMKHTLGSNLRPVWRDFQNYLNERFGGDIERIRKDGIVAGDRLTRHGYETGMAQVDRRGRVIYVRDDWQRHSALMVRDVKGEEEKLTDVNFDARFDLHPEAGIVLAQPDFCSAATLYYDLFRIDPDSGSSRRLTRCGKYHYAAWSPQADRIAAVKVDNGRPLLVMLDREGEPLETLWRGDAGESLSGLDWSPDGQWLVSSRWQPDTGWNLVLFDLVQNQWRRLTQSQAIEMHPRFMPDSRSVLFTSDHGGVYNVRRLSLKGGEPETLTNVAGGAFHPAWDGVAGRLLYTGYDASGFDLYAMASLQLLPTPAAAQGPSATSEPAPPLTSAETWQEDYSPWSSLRPRWWFPHLAFADELAEVGVTTSGSDALGRHSYVIDAAYDFSNEWGAGSFDYIYDRWWPLFKFHASRFSDIDSNDDGDTERVRRYDVQQVELVLPWRRLDWALTTHLAASRYHESDGFVNEDLGILPEPALDDRIAGIGWIWNSTKRYPRSISRSDGRQINLAAESSEMIEGGDYTGSVYTLDWREFVPLFGEHVLAARAVVGWGTRNPRPFELGGSLGAGGPAPLLDSTVINTPFGRRDYALRGYPDDLPELEGRRMHLASLEYRFPIYRLQRGITIPPVGLHQLWGAVFADYGSAWNTDEGRGDKYRAGAGAELHVEAVLFYGLLLDLRIGYAHGYHEGGEDQGYLTLGASF